MYSLFVILTVLSVVCGETTIKVLDTVEALSVDPVNCNYSEEVCGPFYSGIKVTKGGKDWLFTSFGSGIGVYDVTNPSDIKFADSVNLCPGSRGIGVYENENGVSVWTLGTNQFCECRNTTESCSAFRVEIDGEIVDAMKGRLSSVLFTDTPIVGDLALTEPTDACSPLTNPSAIAGKIALIERGGCRFDQKLQHALNAGAIAAVVGNNHYNDPFTAVIAMTGESIALPSLMVSKLVYNNTVNKIKQGNIVSARLGNNIGRDVVDTRFVPFQGLVRIDFDGTSFGTPQFFNDVYNASYIADNFWIHDYHKNWLMLSYTAIENSDGGIITDLYDISSGSLVYLGSRENIYLGPTVKLGSGEDATYYTLNIPLNSLSVDVFTTGTVEEFETSEITQTDTVRYNIPIIIAGNEGFDGEQFWYISLNSFGGGIIVVDTSYLPDYYDARYFWSPTAIYDVSPADWTALGPNKEILATSWASEGIAFFNVSEDPLNPPFLAGSDVFPKLEADHTVGCTFAAYSDTKWIVLTTHAGIQTVELVKKEDPEVECPACEEPQENGPATVINFNFGGMIGGN